MCNSVNIKTLVTWVHYLTLAETDLDFLEEKTHKESSKEFDESGNLLKEISYLPNGDVDEYRENKFDKNNNLILRQSNINGEFGDKIEYQYNESGQIIKEIKHYIDGSTDTIQYKYNTSNNLVEKFCIDCDGELEFKELYEYDNDNHLIKTERIEDEETVMIEELKYGTGNQILTKRFVDKLNDQNQVTHYEYNPECYLIKESIENDSVTSYEYNDFGQVNIERTLDNADNPRRIIENTWQEGNLIEQQETSFTDGIIKEHKIRRTFEYSYF